MKNLKERKILISKQRICNSIYINRERNMGVFCFVFFLFKEIFVCQKYYTILVLMFKCTYRMEQKGNGYALCSLQLQ